MKPEPEQPRSNPALDRLLLSAQTLQHLQLPLALFDEIEFGLVVCNVKRHILFANHAAKQEFADSKLLRRLGDELHVGHGVEADLNAALLHATQRGHRSLVRLSLGHDSLMVSALPLETSSLGTDQARSLLIFGRRQPCSDLGLEMLANSYGLTYSERRVLAALVRDASPQEIATQNKVAMSTVRTQIASIRAKLGVRNIESLLLRAAQVPPVASALRMAA